MCRSATIVAVWLSSDHLSTGTLPVCCATFSSHGDAIARDAQGNRGAAWIWVGWVEVFQAQNISKLPALLAHGLELSRRNSTIDVATHHP